jgi:hypothetical protein
MQSEIKCCANIKAQFPKNTKQEGRWRWAEGKVRCGRGLNIFLIYMFYVSNDEFMHILRKHLHRLWLFFSWENTLKIFSVQAVAKFFLLIN